MSDIAVTVKHLPNKAINAMLIALVCLFSTPYVLANSNQTFSTETLSGSAQQITRIKTSSDITIAVEKTIPVESSTSATLGKTAASGTKSTEKKTAKKVQQEGLFRIYRSNLLKKTYQHVVYPETAIDKNQEGDVVLKIIVNRNGKVEDIEFETRADHSALNRAATRALKRAKPFPAVPKHLEGETFEVLMPIRFRLTG